MAVSSCTKTCGAIESAFGNL